MSITLEIECSTFYSTSQVIFNGIRDLTIEILHAFYKAQT